MRRFKWPVAICSAIVTFVSAAPAEAGSVQEVCSASAIGFVGSSPPLRSDPASSSRCIPNAGAVGSGLSVASQSIPGFVAGGSWAAQSVINVDPAAGISFTGSAEVSNIFYGYAGTSSGFRDLITISAPAGVSGSAFLEIPLHVTGAVTAVGSSAEFPITHSMTLDYYFDSLTDSFDGISNGSIGLTTLDETTTCVGLNCSVVPALLDQTKMIKLPFNFGEQFLLRGSFAVSASMLQASGGIDSAARADFSHTALLGPASIVDGDGNLISGATIESDINYFAGAAVAAVPEPDTFGLLAAGLGCGLAVLRRRRATGART